MTDMKISSVSYSNMTDNVEDVTVSSKNTDGASGLQETEWSNSNWSKYFGYYKTIPEVKTAIDMRAIWTLGKGYKADIETTVILDHISGWGMDTFNSILKNMIVTRRIAGDSFAEIIRDEKTGVLVNLKPLDPGSVKIIVDSKGLIKRYEQSSKTPIGTANVKKFKPEEIFHLTNKRVADEIHGVSDIEAIEEIIKANYENFVDYKKVMHRYVKPMMKFELDTDDTAKIAALATKFDSAVNKGENLYIPMGTVKHEVVSVPSSAALSPMAWREHLRSYFFQVVGIPQIILGSSGEFTESTAKIAYLAFQQSVEDEQLDIEEQVWNQLFLKINLEFPASLQNEMISDTSKDGANSQLGFQPSDMSLNMENQGGG
jgi:hypothetical protein